MEKENSEKNHSYSSPKHGCLIEHNVVTQVITYNTGAAAAG